MTADLTPARLKAACNRAHARRRAAERYGMDLARADIDAIEAAIRDGDPAAVPLGYAHRKKARLLFGLRRAGRWYPVVFDAATDSIITFLSERALDPYRAKLEAVTPAPAPPAPPGPPVGTILGRVELAPKRTVPPGVAATIAALPPLPAPGDLTDAAYESAHARVEAIQAALGQTVKGEPGRGALLDAWAAAKAAVRSLRTRRHEVLGRRSAEAVGAANLGDHGALLAGAYGAMRSMGLRLGWAITAEERAAMNAIQAAFRDAALAGPAAPAP
jgi:hypothetical protein